MIAEEFQSSTQWSYSILANSGKCLQLRILRFTIEVTVLLVFWFLEPGLHLHTQALSTQPCSWLWSPNPQERRSDNSLTGESPLSTVSWLILATQWTSFIPSMLLKPLQQLALNESSSRKQAGTSQYTVYTLEDSYYLKIILHCHGSHSPHTYTGYLGLRLWLHWPYAYLAFTNLCSIHSIA